jgi:hypothetical protein
MANKPNNPSLWSRAKSMARQKFDVYPSAYSNAFAAKWYKSKGGTWRKGEQGMYMKDGGKVSVKAGGENHVIYKKQTKQGKGKVGHIMVNHPTMDKGKWDTIDLTQKAGAKTVAQGVAATKKWHRENPYPKKKMQVGGMTPARQAAKKLAMNMKGKVVGSDRMLKSGGKMFAQAGMGRATFADSLGVYNNAVAIKKYYDNLKNKGWYKSVDVEPNYYSDLKSRMDRVKSESLKTYRDILSKNNDKSVEYKYFKNVYPNKTYQDYRNAVAQSLVATKSGTGNKYYYKDLLPSVIDPMAPSTLVNLNIRPNQELTYKSRAYDLDLGGRRSIGLTPPGGTVTSILTYDPLSVKPYKLRTPAEKIAWEKKYGKPKPTTSTTISRTPRTSSSSRTTTGSTGTSAREAESESILPPMSGTPTASSTSRTTSTPTTSTPTTSREPAPAIKGSAAKLQRFQYMTPEQRQKAVKKYGDPSTWPFQGVDVRGFKKGGKTSKLKQAYFNKYK